MKNNEGVMESKLGRDGKCGFRAEAPGWKGLIEESFLRQGSESQKRGKSRPQHNPRLCGQEGEGW